MNKEALRAVIITQDTSDKLRTAIARRNDLRDKFSLDLPVIFYNASQRSIAHYPLKQKNSLAKKLMLDVYRFCLEKPVWEPEFFNSKAPIENKLIPKTVSFIKKLVEDTLQSEQTNNTNDTVWLDVKQQVETRLASNLNSLNRFFSGHSTNTQIFYQNLKGFMDNQTHNSNNWSISIKSAI